MATCACCPSAIAAVLLCSRRGMSHGSMPHNSGNRRVALHLKRATTTVAAFERPEHQHLRWNKQVQAKLQGIVKTVPITPSLVDPVLRRLCGVGEGCQSVDATTASASSMSPLDTWTLRRQTKYGGNGKHWLNTRPPVLRLFNDKGDEAAVVHPPPILPLPQAQEMSVAAYLRAALGDVLAPPAATMRDVCTYADAIKRSMDGGNNSNNNNAEVLTCRGVRSAAQRDDHESRHAGVGVIVLTREEFTFFVIRSHHDHYVFLHHPERYVSDDHNVMMDPTIDGANGEGLPGRRLKVLTDTLSTFASSLLFCGPFHSASTWYFRVDPDVGDLMKRVLADTATAADAGTSASSFSLDDPRWTMLPRSKLLKNAKWNARPDTMAEEFKYGLVEVLGGASPQILSWGP